MAVELGKPLLALYVAAMIATIVGLDLALFRHRFLARLMVNISVVVVFATVYLRFIRR